MSGELNYLHHTEPYLVESLLNTDLLKHVLNTVIYLQVPLAVCIRSVQAGVYPNVFAAANSIVEAAGPRGLFTGYLPTLLEDVPDMAFKFAAYEMLRNFHRRVFPDRTASVQVRGPVYVLNGSRTLLMCQSCCLCRELLQYFKSSLLPGFVVMNC